MKTSDMGNNKHGRLDLLKDLKPCEAKDCKPKLPKNKKMGKNESGYDILPNEGK